MTIISTVPITRRGYISKGEYEQYTGTTVSDATAWEVLASKAEEMVDAYVGPQDSFMYSETTGRASAGGSSTITLQSDQQNISDVNYYERCEVEILGGTGAGQRNKVSSSTREGVLTMQTAWVTTPDSTSFYKIYQLGKFPRKHDVTFYSEQSPSTYYKQIPEEVKRAVCAQIEYMVEMGDEYFAGNDADKQSESIGDYSYTNASGSTGTNKMISAKSKLLLRGIKNRIGRLVV